MPIKTGPNKGELTAGEIRKLIRGHNKLTNIKVPSGLDRQGLIDFLKKKNFEIDHGAQRLIDKAPARGKSISLDTAKAITKPKMKSEAELMKSADKKKVKAKATKDKEDKIKAEGVKQGAALQRVISKKKAKSAPAPAPKAKPKTAADKKAEEFDKKRKLREEKDFLDDLKQASIEELEVDIKGYLKNIEDIEQGIKRIKKSQLNKPSVKNSIDQDKKGLIEIKRKLSITQKVMKNKTLN